MAFAAALVADASGASSAVAKVQLFRSEDRGASWEYVTTVSDGATNDRPSIAFDPGPGGFAGRLYAVWSQLTPPGIRYKWSEDGGRNWNKLPDPLATDPGYAAHVAVGASGEVYVAWRDPEDGIVVRVSPAGGEEFSPRVSMGAPVVQNVRLFIPASSGNPVTSYPTLAVDRSKRVVFLAWMDANPGAGGKPELDLASRHTDVYLARTEDQGRHWIKLGPVGGGTPPRDQFNHWMAVDPKTEEVHLTFYSSGTGTTRGYVDLVHFWSADSGNNWMGGGKVTTVATDDSESDPDEFGHYSGIAALNGTSIPIWTDHRPGVNEDQVFAATLVNGTRQDLTCAPATIQFQPASLGNLEPGKTRDVEIRVTRNGVPVRDEWLAIKPSQDGRATTDRPSVQTDGAGVAHLEVQGNEEGPGQITAEGAGTVQILPVTVRRKPTCLERVQSWSLLVWAIVVGVLVVIVSLLWKAFKGRPWWVWVLIVVVVVLVAFLVWRVLC
jgi:hypothetical protein